MYIQNLHTHTSFCDGADTPEEMVIAALEKGFDSLGFSGHSYMTYSKYLGDIDRTEDYKKAVSELKIKYEDQIKIYLGLEVDMYSEPKMEDYDYLIGSVHYFNIDNEYVGFDKSEQEVEEIINTYFDGNGMEYAKYYYKTLAQLPQYGNFDIIGHFDLITKHSDNRTFFDAESKEYLNYAFETAEVLAKKIPFFEVNNGAVARGYRKTPYPSIPIMKRLKELGFGAIITSDSHSTKTIDCGFELSTELLKECGFKEKYILTDRGFTAVSL
ncbi:MAG: histidinol-phosphatase [Clostridia bacterium]|nr:histidinol-phosphatase [Clostridia bacterium]